MQRTVAKSLRKDLIQNDIHPTQSAAAFGMMEIAVRLKTRTVGTKFGADISKVSEEGQNLLVDRVREAHKARIQVTVRPSDKCCDF